MSKIICSCGRFADTKEDIDKISFYKVKTPTLKHTSRNEKIVEEYFYYFICPWCEKDIVLIKRKAINALGNKKAVLPVTLEGLEAAEYLARTQENRINKTKEISYMTKPFSNCIDLSYYKTINSTTQRPRYLNESGFSGLRVENKVIVIQ